jgi:hypothetical protein
MFLSEKDRFVFDNLVNLFSEEKDTGSGINTRTIANASDLNIYDTRYSLLKLVSMGYAKMG